jgi:transposase-like protein
MPGYTEQEARAAVTATSYVAVGSKYGVSDNAIRKWLRQYERERAAEEPRAA